MFKEIDKPISKAITTETPKENNEKVSKEFTNMFLIIYPKKKNPRGDDALFSIALLKKLALLHKLVNIFQI